MKSKLPQQPAFGGVLRQTCWLLRKKKRAKKSLRFTSSFARFTGEGSSLGGYRRHVLSEGRRPSPPGHTPAPRDPLVVHFLSGRSYVYADGDDRYALFDQIAVQMYHVARLNSRIDPKVPDRKSQTASRKPRCIAAPLGILSLSVSVRNWVTRSQSIGAHKPNPRMSLVANQ